MTAEVMPETTECCFEVKAQKGIIERVLQQNDAFQQQSVPVT